MLNYLCMTELPQLFKAGFQWGSCYSIFSFICMFCRSLFVFSGVHVTRSLVLYVCFVDLCLFLVGFMLLDLQFYMHDLQIFVLLSFLLWSSVILRFMDFDYPFGISTLLTLPEHLSSTPVFVGFMVLDRQFSVQCFVDHCFCFSFGHCVFCPSIYGF